MWILFFKLLTVLFGKTTVCYVRELLYFNFPGVKSAVSTCPYSPENRSWLQEGEQQSGERRRLNIAGKSFLVDDDGNEVEESRACFVF